MDSQLGNESETQAGAPWTEAMDGSPCVVDLNAYDERDAPLERIEQDRGFIRFQCGPIAEAGVNGTTIEAVIDVLVDRLVGFNSGPFRCRENSLAITALEEARNWLIQRTRERQAQGVEGTNAAHAGIST